MVDEPKDNDKKQDDNVVRIPTLAERDRIRKETNGSSRPKNNLTPEQEKIWQRQYTRERHAGGYKAPSEPFINLPEATKYLAGSLILVHVLMSYILPDAWVAWVSINLSFIPARFTGELPFTPFTIITPISYMWLHGGWTHLLLNTVMLIAFGAGIERWLGAKKLLLMMALCGLFGVLFHMIFFPVSLNPVIGASGGISGFFAVILVMINKGQWRGGPGNIGGGILPFAVLWIGISLLSAFFSGFGAGTIAWAVHIGGFLGGFLLMKSYFKK